MHFSHTANQFFVSTRRHGRKLGQTLAALVVWALLFAGVQGAAAKTLTVAMGGEPDTLDPQKTSLIYTRLINQQMFLPLVVLDDAGDLTAGAAQDWTVSDDRKSYRFDLRQDMQWSDGTPLTSADWVYTFQRALNPETLNPSAQLLFWIANAGAAHAREKPLDAIGVAADGPHGLEINLHTPNPFFLHLLATVDPVPQHVIAAKGTSWTRAGNMVSNGPYQLDKRIPGNKIELTRNDRSHLSERAAIDQLVFLPLTDQPSMTRRFLTGEIDISYSVPPTEYKRVAKKKPGAVHAYASMRNNYLTLNTRTAPLDNPDVRKALSVLVDREVIAEHLVGGAARPALLLIQEGAVGLSDRSKPDWAELSRTERVDLARTLLANAGYRDEKPLHLDFLFVGEVRKRIAIGLQNMWAEAGIKTTLTTKEVQGLFAALNAGDYQIGILAYDMGVALDPYDVLSGFEPGGWADRSGHRDASFDTHMANARSAIKPSHRADALAKAETAFLAGTPVIPLYTEDTMWFIGPQVSGWNTDVQPIYFYRLDIQP